MMYPRRETVLFRLLVSSASLSLSLHLRMWIPARAARTLAGSKKTSGVFYHVACESLISQIFEPSFPADDCVHYLIRGMPARAGLLGTRGPARSDPVHGSPHRKQCGGMYLCLSPLASMKTVESNRRSVGLAGDVTAEWRLAMSMKSTGCCSSS